jgi:hypothetical protein
MKTLLPRFIGQAFSRTELLVALGISSVLAGLFAFGANVDWHAKRDRMACIDNLRKIGISFKSYAGNHMDQFPMGISTHQGGAAEWLVGASAPVNIFRVFQVMSNELTTPKTLLCPKDISGSSRPGRIQATNLVNDLNRVGNQAISYFIGTDAHVTYPSMLLVGDRNLTNSSPPGNLKFDVFVIATSAVITHLGANHTDTLGAGWNDKMHQNSGNVARTDGSVHEMNVLELRNALRNSGDASNKVAVPN